MSMSSSKLETVEDIVSKDSSEVTTGLSKQEEMKLEKTGDYDPFEEDSEEDGDAPPGGSTDSATRRPIEPEEKASKKYDKQKQE